MLIVIMSVITLRIVLFTNIYNWHPKIIVIINNKYNINNNTIIQYTSKSPTYKFIFKNKKLQF